MEQQDPKYKALVEAMWQWRLRNPDKDELDLYAARRIESAFGFRLARLVRRPARVQRWLANLQMDRGSSGEYAEVFQQDTGPASSSASKS